jgi:dehydrogenase/reductase SDR family member 7B
VKDKVAIITGATSGIGKALAYALGRAGAKVVITGRNEEALAEISQDLQRQNIDNLPIRADVTILADNDLMVQKTLAKYGKIDILINNAGMTMRALFEEAEVEVIKRLMEVNFYGAIYATKAALPHILASKGSIVAISSINGFVGTPARSGYVASKFAMNGFFEVLRMEVGQRGVHVLVVAPGFTESNIRKNALTETGKAQGDSPRAEEQLMSAEEVAQRTLQAIQKRKRSIVLTRQGKLAVFLHKFFPAFVNKQAYKIMLNEPNSPLKKFH